MINKLIFTCLSLLLSTTVLAHHNWSALYDVEGDIEIQGVVSKVVWRNPHVIIYFTENEGAADEKTWSTASNSVSALVRMNVTKDLVAVGTKIRAAGYPSRSKDDEFFMNHLLLEDENREIVFLRTAGPRWPEESERVGDANYAHGLNPQEDISERPTSIFAVWSTIFGAEGSHRALTAPDKEFSINYTEQRGEGDCKSKDIWFGMGTPYPMQIVDNEDGTLVIHLEENDTIRTVHLDIEHNDQGTIKNNLGYSTGKFIDDTLTVLTTFKGSNSPIQIHETFSLSNDRNHLNYTQALIDPDADGLPTVSARWWEFQPGSFVQPYDCVSSDK